MLQMHFFSRLCIYYLIYGIFQKNFKLLRIPLRNCFSQNVASRPQYLTRLFQIGVENYLDRSIKTKPIDMSCLG